MENITVTIPAQPWDFHKYLDGGSCYLAEALTNAGYKDVSVIDYGRTFIGERYYKPNERFTSDIVEAALSKNESITVTLIPV